ncbi:hypothetical protein K491DRAFT_759369 [Lophiostoma macrostomum CBS 122681]|uniref:Uncharacterized protein n=1 Tax=Lophiostoma macrostomum CBS 122681 TaxID=1314788 RepID=A0A6A6T4S5_9PLEO|nr:hypothetical protein K491DRAFT_759369 [Lophiostoma macrostomum CBS 122681]
MQETAEPFEAWQSGAPEERDGTLREVPNVGRRWIGTLAVDKYEPWCPMPSGGGPMAVARWLGVLRRQGCNGRLQPQHTDARRAAIDGRGATCWLLHRGSIHAGGLKRRENSYRVTRALHGVWSCGRLFACSRSIHVSSTRLSLPSTNGAAASPGERFVFDLPKGELALGSLFRRRPTVWALLLISTTPTVEPALSERAEPLRAHTAKSQPCAQLWQDKNIDLWFRRLARQPVRERSSRPRNKLLLSTMTLAPLLTGAVMPGCPSNFGAPGERRPAQHQESNFACIQASNSPLTHGVGLAGAVGLRSSSFRARKLVPRCCPDRLGSAIKFLHLSFPVMGPRRQQTLDTLLERVTIASFWALGGEHNIDKPILMPPRTASVELRQTQRTPLLL